MPAAQDPNGFDLTPVNTTFSVAGGFNREAAKVSVRPSGYAYTDLEATLLVAKHLSSLGAPRENLKFWYGVNPATGLIGIYLDLKGEHPGSMPIRDTNNVLYFHLGGVFKEHSHLRPNGNVECGLTFGKDTKGNPCFVFNILKALPKVSRRKSKDGTSKAQKQPGSQADQDAAAGEQG